MNEVILSAENITLGYGDFIAVFGASFRLLMGETAALIGANGAGKTTLLSALAGLNRPKEGKIFFKGEDISACEPWQILDMGLSLVEQGGRCFERMSVEANLLVGSYIKRARKYAAASLERVYSLFPALLEKRKSYAGSLSGGQRQMLAIGRALMARPELICFDEISMGLAPVAIGPLYDCVERIRREDGCSVLLVEQDTQRALRFADTSHVMLEGRIVLSDKSANITLDMLKEAYFGLREGDDAHRSADR